MKTTGPSTIQLIIATTIIVEIALVAVHDAKFWLSSILWMVSLLLCGGCVGFLFGIPSRGPRDQHVADSSAQVGSLPVYPVNTNLEQISDWLTKGIVAIALLNAKEIPSLITSLARFMAGIDPATAAPNNLTTVGVPATAASQGVSVALSSALIINFSTLGFIAGFLASRFAVILAVSNLASALEGSVAKTITAALRPEPLDNYSGFLAVLAHDETKAPVHINQREDGSKEVTVRPRAKIFLSVWFQPERAEAGLFERIELTDGNTVEEVGFQIQVSSASIQFEERTKSIRFSAATSSPILKFTTNELNPGKHGLMRHTILVQVMQKNAVVHATTLGVHFQE